MAVKQKPGTPLIPGAPIEMGGREWIVPPLTLGQLRRLMPKVRSLTSAIGANMGENEIGVLVEVVTAALQRNYPDMTPEVLENLLDMGNANSVLMTVLTGSGLKKGEAEAAGSTGPTFTDSSPQPADGPTP